MIKFPDRQEPTKRSLQFLKGVDLDILWLIPWFRKRRIEAARAQMQAAHKIIANIESTLQPYSVSNGYVPERVRQPLFAQISELSKGTLPSAAKTVRRTRDRKMLDLLESVERDQNQVRSVLTEQNEKYVEKMITEHSKLLIEELQLDTAQLVATVRDDERNLVIAAAGSGKTRTLIARVRYLLERGISPSSVLAVTFTNKATEEMEDRLKQMNVLVAEKNHEGVTVSTLHALGKRVVQANFPGPISVADQGWTESLVAETLREVRTGARQDLARLYLDAILNFHRDQDESVPDEGKDMTYRTLRGEHVRSVGERIIADFLFTHNVRYKHEAKAPWAPVGQGYGAYHPDFTLLDKGTCIEYWGINRRGEVPSSWARHGGTTSAEYKRGMEWKRNTFHQQRRILIEFYDYERTEGTLANSLQERLTSAGVTLRPMSLQELENVHGDTKYIGDAIERLLVQFIANARSLKLSPIEIRKRLNKAKPRVFHFGLLGIAVLEQYESQLLAEGRIDFADMLHRAANILEKGADPLPKIQHILVDEFQDTSAAMAQFLKALLVVNKARLFAVGDDWQAIYGFAGGEIDHIVNFENHFGLASKTMLNVNYRSPGLIVEAGSALIAHNSNQIPKQIEVHNHERGEALVHEVPDDDASIVGTTLHLIEQERRLAKEDKDILVLSRTKHLLEKIREACKDQKIPVADPDRDLPGVRILSGHKAKGLEASTVIIVNASDHIFGFPSKVENPDVLAPVRMSSGNDEAEERRLFYVAVTRAMKRLHLVVRKGLPSPYIAEIEGTVTGYSSSTNQSSSIRPGGRFNDLFHVNQVYQLSDPQKRAGIRQSGVLATNTERFRFTSFLPFYLQAGQSYWLEGVLKDQPYRDHQEVRLDSFTRVESCTSISMNRTYSERNLIPRPPPAYQPIMAQSLSI